MISRNLAIVRRSPRIALLPALALLAGLAAAFAGPGRSAAGPDPAVAGQWSSVLPWPIVSVHLNVLPNGKLLFWQRTGDRITHSDARIWDPNTGAFAAVPNAQTNMFCAGHAF